MYQLILRIATTVGLALIVVLPALPQSGGGIGIGGGMAAGMMVGPGGLTGSRGDDKATTFTYNFPKGSTVVAVTGAPYSGHNSSQNIRTLANGTHLTQAAFDQPMTYRDTMGRTRTEAASTRPMQMPNGGNIQPQITRLAEIVDPVAGYHYILDSVHQIAYRAAIQVRQNQAQNGPAAAARMATVSQPERTMENGATMKMESLGTQTMFGVTVNGQRSTTTYPIGTYEGNDQPVVQINENWRSLQYGMMLSKNSGPNGDSTTTMKDFSADEPDPSLFQLPAGYQVVDETGEFTITIPRDAR